eukprot:jgi/Hompol1/3248/HPOL_006427-RA
MNDDNDNSDNNADWTHHQAGIDQTAALNSSALYGFGQTFGSVADQTGFDDVGMHMEQSHDSSFVRHLLSPFRDDTAGFADSLVLEQGTSTNISKSAEPRFSMDEDDEALNNNGGYEDEAEDDAEMNGDDVPDGMRTMMEAALESVGSHRTYQDVLFEEDEEAIQEIEDIMGEGRSSNYLRDNRRRHGSSAGRKKKKASDRHLNDTIPARLLETFGQANLAYAMGNHAESIEHLHEVIRQYPTALQAWLTLAMVHESVGDRAKTHQCYLMAAHLSPKDVDLWRKLAQLATEMEDSFQTIYCLNQIVRIDPLDAESQWSRALLHRDLGRFELAVEGFQAVHRIFPENVDVIKELARIYVQLEDQRQAIRLFEEMMAADEI